MKKHPVYGYEKQTGNKPYLGTLAYESSLRTLHYMKEGCNFYSGKRSKSTPLGFWLEQDIWSYIKKYNLPISSIYSKGYTRTGCMFCMFGIHLEKEEENRFQRMKHTHPKHYEFCINALGCGKVLDFIKVSY